MESGLVSKLMTITLLGSEWVLWLLIGLSVASIAVMIDRGVFFRRTSIGDFAAFFRRLAQHLNAHDFEHARALCRERRSMEGQVALLAIDNVALEPEAVERLIASQIAVERKAMERGLTVLGTLGNNTPFIGLFGTVIGIIQAFHALALNPAGGSAVVMASISEALIATAVGLMVAIPAVIAFNLFQRLTKSRLSNTEAVRELVLSHVIQIHAQKTPRAS